MSTVISVENVSKQYRLGEVGTGSLAHDVNRWWHKVRGKEDPYLKVGETNDRSKKGSSEYAWALKDISFEVKQGEVLGIIGRNGAGKSTLLKILSRVTQPTTGQIKVKGRIASLLEVGTGFHPELSGRENIFLNGAILGMRKAEIARKLDEIIDFSGCERYIDTPVKRYSSGMYVRLAFAVAAHLEPEILIIDEVLAVGDAEFQKKCLGKMKDVAGEGRTVLFVSHNMGAVGQLCSQVICLSQGQIKSFGKTSFAIEEYIRQSKIPTKDSINRYSPDVNKDAQILQIRILDSNGNQVHAIGHNFDWSIEVEYVVRRPVPDLTLGLLLRDHMDRSIGALQKVINFKNSEKLGGQNCKLRFLIAKEQITPRSISINAAFHIPNVAVLDSVDFCDVLEISDVGSEFAQYTGDYGMVFLKHDVSWG